MAKYDIYFSGAITIEADNIDDARERFESELEDINSFGDLKDEVAVSAQIDEVLLSPHDDAE